jgi:hypothetical protein
VLLTAARVRPVAGTAVVTVVPVRQVAGTAVVITVRRAPRAGMAAGIGPRLGTVLGGMLVRGSDGPVRRVAMVRVAG